MFSKVKPKETILGLIAMVLFALLINYVPGLALVFIIFATLPGIILWHKSIPSFGIAAFITVLITVLFSQTYTLTIMIIILFVSALIGQLLKRRFSKERILYLATVGASITTLLGILGLQATKAIPLVGEWFKPIKEMYKKLVEIQAMDSKQLQMMEQMLDQLTIITPAMMIRVIFVLVLLSLLVTFPILRKFKVATPSFRPLYSWQIDRSVISIYFVVLICSLFITEKGVFQSIIMNLQIVLELAIFLQGLSVIHYFGKMKKMPTPLTIVLIILGVFANFFTVLLGILDLGFNLKKFIKKK